METTMMDVFETQATYDLQVIEGLPQPMTVEFVPAPLPSDIFQQAIDTGWTLMHGTYISERMYTGCAVGAIRQGLAMAEMLPFASTHSVSSGRIYQEIQNLLPQLSEKTIQCADGGCARSCTCDACKNSTVLGALEHGYECHGWSAERCVEYLRSQEV